LTRLLDRIGGFFTATRTVGGVAVGIFMPLSADESTALFAKVGEALGLLETYAPVRFSAARADVLGGILVRGRPDEIAHYDPICRRCELYVDWVKDPEVTPAAVALAVIHEAQHARLFRLGFGYEPAIQPRIERLCFRAERAVARRLPDGAALVKSAEAGMNYAPESYSRATRQARERAGLAKLAEQNWIITPLLWWYDVRSLWSARRARAGRRSGA
jgi:hypothetical protein